MQAEIQRREAVARDETEKRTVNSAATRWPWLVTASISLAVASLWLTLVSDRGSLSGLLTLIFIGGTLLSIRQASFERAIAARNPTADIWSNLTTPSLGLQFLTALWLATRLYRHTSWFIPALFVVVAMVCHVFAQTFR